MEIGMKVGLNLRGCTPERKEQLKDEVFGNLRSLEGTIISSYVKDGAYNVYRVKWSIDSEKTIDYLMNGSELYPYSRFNEGQDSYNIHGLGTHSPPFKDNDYVVLKDISLLNEFTIQTLVNKRKIIPNITIGVVDGDPWTSASFGTTYYASVWWRLDPDNPSQIYYTAAVPVDEIKRTKPPTIKIIPPPPPQITSGSNDMFARASENKGQSAGNKKRQVTRKSRKVHKSYKKYRKSRKVRKSRRRMRR